MIYEIDNKYYVKVGYEYNEIEIKPDDTGEVVLVPLKNRIDGNGKQIREIIFKNEKDNFKKKLESKKEYNYVNYTNVNKNKNRSKWS